MDIKEEVRQSWNKRFPSQVDATQKSQSPPHSKPIPTDQTPIVISSDEEESTDAPESDGTDEERHLAHLEELKEVEILTDSSDDGPSNKANSEEIIEEIEDESQIEELGDDFQERKGRRRQEEFAREKSPYSDLNATDIISDGVDVNLPARKRRRNASANEKLKKVVPPFKPFHNPVYDKPSLQSSVTIHDILSNPDIESSYLFTYYIELKEFLSYFKSPLTNVSVIVQQDHVLDTEDISLFPNLSIMQVRMKPYTSHHCKLVLNKYRNGDWKMYLISCNLMRAELVMNNQISWESPRLPKLKPGTDHDDSSRFKASFIRFLKGYRPFLGSRLNSLIAEIEKVNFNSVIGDFISSVPGKTSFEDVKDHGFEGFGLKGLMNALKVNNLFKPSDVDILYQSSSIASATNHEKSTNKVSNIFTHLIIPYLTSPRPSRLPIGEAPLADYLTRNNINIRIVYPTVDNILLSKFGNDSGTWSVFNGYSNVKALEHLKLLKKFFYKPYSTQREYNTSHSKFVVASSDSFKTLDWCFFTTCNISKQAWGNILKYGTENYVIDNFESGVLISKNHYKGYKLVPVEIGETERVGGRRLAADEIPVVLPFDLRQTRKYEKDDEPWCIGR
ncbi:hypothetical protein WICPIJ_004821 [Wickerhamomyces pijperi]|uniref:Tyrosyl-DNA phosphodiesterase 1 n=1 Tax=Wickerhamomyces pijperi TaxID=599730 RepID=A0A9P8Q4P5_WICPI|nr:hypothetical protein WICPIJ_004821 [Wickerhamomyces pijperi]